MLRSRLNLGNEMYQITASNGTISYEHHKNRESIKAYFERNGVQKPPKIKVKGYPFEGMYLVSGTEENGTFVAKITD